MKIKPELEKEYSEYVTRNANDPYVKEIIQYSERWAELMEANLESGQAIPDMAEKSSATADTSEITGFMYDCAVSDLYRFWIHGEELRQWHNIKTQIGNEGEKANKSGGVLNPALLCIGEK